MILLFTSSRSDETIILASIFGSMSSTTMAVTIYFCVYRDREKLITSKKRIVAKIKNMSDNAVLLNHDDNIIIEMVQ